MRWLLHGQLTAAVGENLRRREDQTVTLQEIGLADDAPVDQVLREAQRKQLDVITVDPALSEQPYQQDWRFGRSIVQLAVDGAEVEQDDALDRLFTRYKRLTPCRLYVVTNTRVKIRQLPSAR